MATPKKIHVKKNDTVVVISGKDAGKKGKVLVAMPSEGKIIVEGVAMATKHKKPRGLGQQGGIVHQEAPIYASKVMLVCPSCGKPTRLATKAFDGRGNYALGIREQLLFPEIEYDKVDKIRGMEMIFVTTAKTDEEARELLRLLGMPFAQA